MSAALGTTGFDASHTVALVAVFFNALFVCRLVKTWPASTGIELGFGVEQWLAATRAHIGSGILGLPILSGEGAFGTGLAGDVILLRRQLLTPFLFGLNNFIFD